MMFIWNHFVSKITVEGILGPNEFCRGRSIRRKLSYHISIPSTIYPFGIYKSKPVLIYSNQSNVDISYLTF